MMHQFRRVIGCRQIAGRRDGIAHSDLLTIDARELRVGTVKIASGAGWLFTSPLPEAGSCTVPV
jgi:hypothetical protein